MATGTWDRFMTLEGIQNTGKEGVNKVRAVTTCIWQGSEIHETLDDILPLWVIRGKCCRPVSFLQKEVKYLKTFLNMTIIIMGFVRNSTERCKSPI